MSVFIRRMNCTLARALWVAAEAGLFHAVLGVTLELGSWLPWAEVPCDEGALIAYLGGLMAISCGGIAAFLPGPAQGQ